MRIFSFMLTERGKKGLICSFLALSVAFSFGSCRARDLPSSGAILNEMLTCESVLPKGQIYSSESSPGAPDYLSDSLLQALYGGEECPAVMKRVKSAAIRVSSGFSASEYAVFLCESRADTRFVAELCLKRLDVMRYFVNSTSGRFLASDADAALEGAQVSIFGKYVFMAVSECGGEAVKRAREAAS